MGLDGVELVMAVEEAFDLQITDADALKMQTPRDMIDFVLSKVTTTTATVCLTQRAFNLLRKSLIRHGGWKRSEIKPDAKLAILIPTDRRRPLLQQVIAELNIKRPPELVRPKWASGLVIGATLGASGGAAAGVCPEFCSLAVWVFILVALVFAGIGIRLTKPLCREFPSNLQTVGDFARWVMTHKSDLADSINPAWTREQVEACVREIIVDTLGCKPDFSLDANFIKDLGVG